MTDIVVEVVGSGSSSSGLGLCEPWASTADLCSPCDDYSADAGYLETMLQAASEILHVLSGRQFPGVCEDLIRPRYGCGCLYRNASCSHTRRELALPQTPVVEVLEVVVDGVTLTEGTHYKLLDRRSLRRIDDESWPAVQDLDLPDTEEDTWSVRYTFGLGPPASGVLAAATLACELAKACQPEEFGDSECKLPERVTSITREGVSMIVLDPFAFLEKGRTGLYEVDLFLSAVNPQGARRRARAFSPDTIGKARREG